MKEKSIISKIKHSESGLTWINISNPDLKSVEYLKKTYKFHELDLEDCLSKAQRPKIDDYEDYLFLVLHLPYKTSRKNRIKSAELDVFIGQDFVVTLHNSHPELNNLHEELSKNKEQKEEYMGKGAGYFLYMLIDNVFDASTPILDDLNKQLDELERDVFESDQSKDRLKDILMLKKDIINYRRIIMPERAILAQLEHKNKKFLPEDLNVYFDDIVDKVEKMWNTLENLQELIDSLQETNESIISHTTNNVIKILTIFSVVMLPLTFVTGFYGMNINGLPLAQHPLSTVFVAGFMGLVVISMIGYFRYKKWL
ncbi:magnesium/cobalt transporter CorA [Patescibacteria group bacterium]|nr:magnesium/cobalt transporter CorA [Patescibacteria group bacterium]